LSDQNIQEHTISNSRFKFLFIFYWGFFRGRRDTLY